MRQYWKRIVIAAIAAELLHAIYLYFGAPSPQVVDQPVGFGMEFGLFVAAGLWCAKNMRDVSPILAGILVGVAGALIHYALQAPALLTGDQIYPRIVQLHHIVKMAGGASGALMAIVLLNRRRKRR